MISKIHIMWGQGQGKALTIQAASKDKEDSKDRAASNSRVASRDREDSSKEEQECTGKVVTWEQVWLSTSGEDIITVKDISSIVGEATITTTNR